MIGDFMNRLELIKTLNKMLLNEMPMYQPQADTFSNDIHSQRDLLRSLMNIRPALPLNPEFVKLQNELLSTETAERGVVDVNSLPTTSDDRIILWQGDITRLNADAIVNANLTRRCLAVLFLFTDVLTMPFILLPDYSFVMNATGLWLYRDMKKNLAMPKLPVHIIFHANM